MDNKDNQVLLNGFTKDNQVAPPNCSIWSKSQTAQFRLLHYISVYIFNNLKILFYRCHLVGVILTVRVHLDKIVDTK